MNRPVIIKMSVDVFGRNLKREARERGPPGFGFKATIDGQYDLDNKRLCNIAAPNAPTDAVNLQTVRRIIQEENSKILQLISELRADLRNLDEILEVHRDELEEKINKNSSEIQKYQEIFTRNLEVDAIAWNAKN